jgi:hypothetical protein
LKATCSSFRNKKKNRRLLSVALFYSILYSIAKAYGVVVAVIYLQQTRQNGFIHEK